MINHLAWKTRCVNLIRGLTDVQSCTVHVGQSVLGRWVRLLVASSRTHGTSPQPEWMKLSAVAPLKAGGVIIRDLRAWVSVHTVRVLSSSSRASASCSCVLRWRVLRAATARRHAQSIGRSPGHSERGVPRPLVRCACIRS